MSKFELQVNLIVMLNFTVLTTVMAIKHDWAWAVVYLLCVGFYAGIISHKWDQK